MTHTTEGEQTRKGGTIPLGEFLDRLGGITEADVKKALRSYKSGNEGGE